MAAAVNWTVLGRVVIDWLLMLVALLVGFGAIILLHFNVVTIDLDPQVNWLALLVVIFLNSFLNLNRMWIIISKLV